MPMSPERAALLAELLTELAEDPKGFIPNEAWYAAHKALALPFIEVAIVRLKAGVPQVLLSHRVDRDWKGWHAPGGLWRTKQSLEACIKGIVKEEVGANASVELFQKGSWLKWDSHHYGNPISHVAICTGTGIVERDDLKWFSEVPHDMIDDGGRHAGFITEALQAAQSLA